MKTNTGKITNNILALLAMLLVNQSGSAAEYEASVRAGVGVSDNISRTSQFELDETIATIGFDFHALEKTSRLDLRLDSNFEYVDYLDNTFEAELIGGLNAVASIMLIEERLRWVVQNNFGQQLFDPLQPSRPGNRENVNFFTTGPTLNLLAGSRNQIVFDARYSRVNFETRNTDNDRVYAAISFGREVSRESSVSLNYSVERIEFDDAAVAAPIDRNLVFVRYEKTGFRNTFGIDLGYNEVESDGDAGSGVLLEIEWTRATSANGLLTMTGGSRFSDQGNVFRSLQDIALDLRDTIDLPESSEPFLNYSYTVDYVLQHERYSIDMNASWNQEDYKGQSGIDRDMYRGNMRFRREVSRTVFAGANIGFQRRDYKYITRRDDDLTLGLLIGYRITAGLDISLEYQHFRRNSIEVDADFTENRAFVSVTYTPRWSRKRI